MNYKRCALITQCVTWFITCDQHRKIATKYCGASFIKCSLLKFRRDLPLSFAVSFPSAPFFTSFSIWTIWFYRCLSQLFAVLLKWLWQMINFCSFFSCPKFFLWKGFTRIVVEGKKGYTKLKQTRTNYIEL